MATPRKAPAKKAPPARRNGSKPKPAPVLKASRFAAFESASDEWKGEPVGFDLDGRVWLCDGEPSSIVVKYLRDPGHASTAAFIEACIVAEEREEWVEFVSSNPVPGKLLSGIAGFLMRVYAGLEPGK